MDLLGDGARWLTSQRHAAMTKEVTYTRGAQEVDLNATVGRSIEQQQDQESGQVFEFETRDFLIRSADLILGSVTVTPLPGDTITEDGIEHRVLPNGTEPSWRYADQERTTIRVRTKKVGS